MRVREGFKGDLNGVVEVRDAAATRCSWPPFEMAAPGRYVIFANVDEGELVTPAFCRQAQPLSGSRIWRRSAPTPGRGGGSGDDRHESRGREAGRSPHPPSSAS